MAWGLAEPIATFPSRSPAAAQLFNSAIDQLPPEQRVTLRSGQPLVTGEKGRYTARVLIPTSSDIAWSVLTDYGNLSKFMPNVTSSKILSANGNQKVVEQVDTRQVFFLSVTSRIRSAITEKAKSRIDFRQVEGDLQSLQGYWKIEAIAPYAGAKPTQVLITQVVEAQPNASTPKGIFYGIFKESLGEAMSAIEREALRRGRS
ncbi:cyclase/dehydrase [Myxacorys almedinensis A]|uniref:Cyclase/dehydrase n=2 Tax=Myxacorys TaxID=2056239 RepID=A0A8J7Z839_9CYAN|nr:cyclase/dehydrase [Myxacorys almedinensis A]